MRKARVLVFIVAVLLSASTVVSAQPNSSDRGRGQHRDRDRGANIENLRLLKMLEVLDLSEKQSDEFIPLFHQFRRDTRELRHKRKIILDSLADLLDRENSESQLSSLFDELQKNFDRLLARTRRFIDDCAEIFTPYQLGRLLLFNERFEREVLESLREFRRNRPHAPIEDNGR